MGDRVDSADSLLNRGGRANVAGATGLFDPLPTPAASVAIDPASVSAASRGAHADIVALVNNRCGARAVAQRLLELYGPFTASSSRENRQAIIDNLLWIAGSGIAYDRARADRDDTNTLAPNETLRLGRGICRDTHTALAAILSSLMTANGADLGSPSNTGVSVLGFSTANERHAVLLYRDPASGAWNAIEYGTHYALAATSDTGALSALVGDVPTCRRYFLNGWDGAPTIAARDALAGAVVQDFFRRDPGRGKLGHLRLDANGSTLAGTLFLQRGLALQGEVSPLENRGGLKLDYHHDLADPSLTGFVHAAAGFHHIETSLSDTEMRGSATRKRFSETIYGLQLDGSLDGHVAIAGDAFALSGALDWDVLVPVGVITPRPQLRATTTETLAKSELGLAAGVFGEATLDRAWRFAWAARYRHELDLFAIVGNAMMSGGESLAPVFDDGALSYAAAVSHDGEVVRTRFEIGGALAFGASDEALRASHYVSASAASDGVRAGFLLSGTGDEGCAALLDAITLAASTSFFESSLELGARVTQRFDAVAPVIAFDLSLSL